MQQLLDLLHHHFKTPFGNPVLVFTVLLLVILFSPIFLRKLKVPAIIGFIISGVVIGPHALNIIEKTSAITLFSTIGLLYIMFLAGLELDMREFSKNKHKSLIFGVLTFIVPLVIGFFTCYSILGYDFQASLLTASMFSTQTLVAYPIVMRLGIARTEPVAVTVGGTIITDTAVLVLLAVISGANNGGLNSAFWLRFIISISLFFFISLYILPKISAWFFKVLESEKNSHFIFVLTIVFLCAFLAELAGLEPIIGAFVAGILLNKLIPHTSSLMNRIEFVGTSLFIPFFLIGVGMLINVKVLFTNTATIYIAVVLTLVAIFTKFLAAWFSGLILKYNRHQINLIFGLSSSHAAATLAIILVGYNMGIIDENILNGTIVLILITCLVASFVTDRAAKKLVSSTNNVKEQLELLTQQRVLVPISNPATMEKLIDFSIMIQQQENRFPILGVSIVKDGENAQIKLIESRKLLSKVIEHASTVDQKVDIVATIDQNVSNGIARTSKEYFASEIVLGWPEKDNISEYIFGKTTRKIIAQTTQTVFLCNFPTPLTSYKKMVIIASPLVESETGFGLWVDRMVRVSKIMSLKLFLRSNNDTFQRANAIVTGLKLGKTVHPLEMIEELDYPQLFTSLAPDELPVIVIPRNGTLSYLSQHEHIPSQLHLLGVKRSFITIYPEIRKDQTILGISEDFDSSSFNKGVDQIQERFKLFRNWFKKTK